MSPKCLKYTQIFNPIWPSLNLSACPDVLSPAKSVHAGKLTADVNYLSEFLIEELRYINFESEFIPCLHAVIFIVSDLM